MDAAAGLEGRLLIRGEGVPAPKIGNGSLRIVDQVEIKLEADVAAAVIGLLGQDAGSGVGRTRLRGDGLEGDRIARKQGRHLVIGETVPAEGTVERNVFAVPHAGNGLTIALHGHS